MLDADGGLLRGTLDLLILKALSWGPRHGYAVAEWIDTITDGELLVEQKARSTRHCTGSSDRDGWSRTGAFPKTTAGPSSWPRSSAAADAKVSFPPAKVSWLAALPRRAIAKAIAATASTVPN